MSRGSAACEAERPCRRHPATWALHVAGAVRYGPWPWSEAPLSRGRSASRDVNGLTARVCALQQPQSLYLSPSGPVLHHRILLLLSPSLGLLLNHLIFPRGPLPIISSSPRHNLVLLLSSPSSSCPTCSSSSSSSSSCLSSSLSSSSSGESFIRVAYLVWSIPMEADFCSYRPELYVRRMFGWAATGEAGGETGASVVR